MGKSALYSSLRTDLLTITGVKHVSLWNNQIERENVEKPFLYPAIFIQFLPSEYRDLANKATVQQYDMIVRLHICSESYEDVNTDVLDLADAVWQKVHKKQYGDFGELLRRNEEQNFDHPNVQVYVQDYKTLGRDIKTSTLVEATVSPVLIKSIIDITEA